jgi:hypothetical protein
MRSWLLVSLLFTSTAGVATDEITLFNGKDLTGWTCYANETGVGVGGCTVADMATVHDGVIEINPKARGALITQENYHHYKLHAEYRWGNPTGGNSGIFVRIQPNHLVSDGYSQPGRYMIQVQTGASGSNTGDLWVLGTYSESRLKTPPERSNAPYGTGKGHLRQHIKIKDAEMPAGEWNTIEATLVGPNATIYLNGELVQEASNLIDLPGRIGLEPEGAPIQFRNLRVTRLPDPPPRPTPSRTPRPTAGNTGTQQRRGGASGRRNK